jgi:hypothetical protein
MPSSLLVELLLRGVYTNISPLSPDATIRNLPFASSFKSPTGSGIEKSEKADVGILNGTEGVAKMVLMCCDVASEKTSTVVR